MLLIHGDDDRCQYKAMKQEHIGSDFDDFLDAEHLLAECEAGALKRVIAWQIEQEMKRRKISRAKLANRMKTNRAKVDRLFSRKNLSVTLELLEQAALALEQKLRVELP
jgi:antitoxin HicB